VKPLGVGRKQAWYFHGDTKEAGTTIVGRVCAFGISTNSNGARSFRWSQGAYYSPCSALKKTACGNCGSMQRGWYDRRVRQIRDLSCGDTRVYLELEVRRVLCRSCGKVKREGLEFLADNPFYTKRFAYYVGRRCRTATIKDVAKEFKLDWKPKPKVIGIDEISIRKGHTYRIVVSDLEKSRPIWFGGTDRSEQSMRQFFDELGKPKSTRIRLAVMDMWKPFRNATQVCAPQAAILYDKFHVMRHLGEALDQVRKSEYGRLASKNRGFIKGQKYACAVVALGQS
jgi:transposase